MSATRFVLDTSVLLNFGVIGRFGLLLEFLGRAGAVTAWVYEEEVRHPGTKQALKRAVEGGLVEVIVLETLAELQLLGRLLRERDISEGEAETIVAAASRGWVAVLDDRVATAKARKLLPPDRLMDTHQLLRTLIERGRLSHAEAVQVNEVMRRAGRWLGEFKYPGGSADRSG